MLGRALPTEPLDRFIARSRSLPRTTEAERLVIQRIGQDIFREALIEFWNGRCPLSGIDEPLLLRASHIKDGRKLAERTEWNPWSACSIQRSEQSAGGERMASSDDSSQSI